jgi:YVTN family beta-propeller protein
MKTESGFYLLFRCGFLALILVCVAFFSSCNAADKPTYQGPFAVAAAGNGKTVYVACEDSNKVLIVDLAGKVTGQIDMPATPTGLVISPNKKQLFVTCSALAGKVAVVDLATNKVAATWAVGYSPTGPVVSPDGKTLYVCYRFKNQVGIVDTASGKEIGRVAAKREPVAAAISPDGKTLFVANLIPLGRADSYNVASVVTVVNTASRKALSIRLPNGSASLHGVAVTPDGKYALVTHILARYQMPTTQLERGWMNTNALSIIDVKTKKLVNTVLLDDVDLGAANPWGVACMADGKTVCVTHAGSHELSVIDFPGLIAKLLAMPKTREEARKDKKDLSQYSSIIADDVPNDLAFLVGLRKRIKLDGKGPRGLAIVGNRAVVTQFFSDNLALVDLTAGGRYNESYIALGPKVVLDQVRQGQLFFSDAGLCFQQWQSCISCHPDARVDGLNWDLLNDGLGNPKNVKSMFKSHETGPAMSTGIRKDAQMAVRAGITHIQFAVRPDEDAQAIDAYLKALAPVPSPFLVDGKLSAAAERGKILFESKKAGCSECHPAPLFTDMKMHNVQSKGKYDRREDFDTPTLLECWRTAPYMHDGHYVTIKELLIEGMHGQMLAPIDELSEQEINDLVEYVKSL